VCTNKIKFGAAGDALRLDGDSVRGKPVDALTIAIWLNMIREDNSQSIFSVLNSKNQGECGHFPLLVTACLQLLFFFIIFISFTSLFFIDILLSDFLFYVLF